jgi:hypothetical protein
VMMGLALREVCKHVQRCEAVNVQNNKPCWPSNEPTIIAIFVAGAAMQDKTMYACSSKN